jgi:predicted nucleotidyltransferase
MLYRLRTMTDAQFEALPYGSEGLWRKLMRSSRSCATLEEILESTKSKRYTRTRLDRMVMCAYLDISPEMIASPAPYVRLLAFNDKGRSILRKKKEDFPVVNAGETVDHPYWTLEKRAGDLYGLFCTEGLEPPAAEENRRVVYVR